MERPVNPSTQHTSLRNALSGILAARQMSIALSIKHYFGYQGAPESRIELVGSA